MRRKMAVSTGTARSEEPVEACLGGWLKSGDDCPQTHERENIRNEISTYLQLPTLTALPAGRKCP
ncbi:hypothetical protein [Bacillus kexueae]|uniref:hypothetical protein n=1 Tax=Aeribacillus kexueae TaxID=2078952 RepID=UPI001FAF329D|nr:hypothetical protein [Bacillus kexueae]